MNPSIIQLVHTITIPSNPSLESTSISWNPLAVAVFDVDYVCDRIEILERLYKLTTCTMDGLKMQSAEMICISS